MATTREQVAQALLTLVQGMTFASPINGQSAWVTTSRRLKLWGSVNPAEQPAAFVVAHNEMDEYRGLGLLRIRLHYSVWCYSRTDDQSTVGDVDLNTMLASFETLFPVTQDSTGSNTLGGLVYWSRIEGRVFKDPGDIDGQTLLIVPIVIEMP
jgi:hypothetical protein